MSPRAELGEIPAEFLAERQQTHEDRDPFDLIPSDDVTTDFHREVDVDVDVDVGDC